MAIVHLQRAHSRFTGGTQLVTVDGATVGQLIDELDRRWPGLGAHLREGSSVAIDSAIIANGEFEQVDDDTHVHFIAQISGG